MSLLFSPALHLDGTSANHELAECHTAPVDPSRRRSLFTEQHRQFRLLATSPTSYITLADIRQSKCYLNQQRSKMVANP